MIAAPSRAPGPGTFARGIHPPERKGFAAEVPIEIMPNPVQVAIPLLQHTGAPCEPLVKVKDEVTLGQKIGEGKGFITAPVHASVAGAVGMPSVTTLPNGRHVKTIPIKTGPNQLSADELKASLLGGDWPVSGLDAQSPEQIAQTAREAGLVGLGGAAFPTHVKLTRNEKRPVDTLLLNGCECEPYLTSDYRLMIEFPRPIVTGALLAARATGATQLVIAVEDNKPAAVESLRRAAEGTGVEVRVMETRYPMGGERQVIPAALDREVPTGGLPLDVGVVVMNVGTSAALAAAVLRGKTLTHRVVSVTGAGIAQPKNVLAPIGSSYKDLIDFCGGLKPDAARVIAGGPMMGFALNDLNITVTKGTSGITVLTHDDLKAVEETACVRCGRCVDVCPLNLVPTRLALASRYQDWDMARRYHLMACCECGCCAYVCPAAIPLVQLMRMGKAQLPKE
ncbi:MAG TPA: electron transport complex subunit RsxC [Kiritimatiellia bacterium]|nr:electron transport complex subunit RsxC [Kiritimatiellia bacterium]HRZ12746.1 electron transport complex subunit RsxC [Kiritimatiellia bacterium]HSA18302.1 electron transport complex subunit RsxC [Kiritimatiellia bacterium]